MRIEKYLTILFLCSLLIFGPAFESAERVELIPKRVETIIYEVHMRKIEFKCEQDIEIKFNISILDDQSNKGELIQTGKFINEILIDIEDTGYIIIELFAENVATIEIRSKSIRIGSLVFFWIIAILNGILLYRKYNAYFDV
ncbi:MAG: hypothetical protein OEZ01_06810 [Candidatus Heimdallarchaeota archaeon]|nr:hypothetical protein [Candidatus Heimdallarchaeota archaeon]MDH5645700.1 hypothetical protein [Candidatus Heimdallarchaeota archaeon]